MYWLQLKAVLRRGNPVVVVSVVFEEHYSEISWLSCWWHFNFLVRVWGWVYGTLSGLSAKFKVIQKRRREEGVVAKREHSFEASLFQ